MGNSVTEKLPSAVVWVVRNKPVSVFFTVTVAPATASPDESVTVPRIVPRNVWAFAATARESTTRIAKTRRFMDRHPPHRDKKCRLRAATRQHALKTVKLLEKLHGEPFAFGSRIQTYG